MTFSYSTSFAVSFSPGPKGYEKMSAELDVVNCKSHFSLRFSPALSFEAERRSARTRIFNNVMRPATWDESLSFSECAHWSRNAAGVTVAGRWT